MKFNYKIKQINEDFIVDEVSLKPDFYNSNKSSFSYLWIKKRGMTTFEALEILRKEFELQQKSISHQGLKDEDGVTSQLISIRKIIFQRDLDKFNLKYKIGDFQIQIENILGYGKKELAPRLLHGNKFKLVIRNLNKKEAESFYKFCQNNRLISFINYYDKQRFGIVGGPYNTHLIGKGIAKQDWVKAYKEFKKSKNNDLFSLLPPKKIDSNNCKKFFKQLNFNQVHFFIPSYNSYLWNKKVNNYINKINKNNFQYFFSGIGLMSFIKKENSFIQNIIAVKGCEINKGNYKVSRKEYIRNLQVTTTVFPINIDKDELNKGKYRARVSFFLPTGSYATMLIKQIFIKL
jgi:tRNA pseudouridine13 synthase